MVFIIVHDLQTLHDENLQANNLSIPFPGNYVSTKTKLLSRY